MPCISGIGHIFEIQCFRLVSGRVNQVSSRMIGNMYVVRAS